MRSWALSFEVIVFAELAISGVINFHCVMAIVLVELVGVRITTIIRERVGMRLEMLIKLGR